MEKQEIRTFGRRHGKKLSARQILLLETVLPTILPNDIKQSAILEIGFGAGEHLRELALTHPDSVVIGAEPFMNGVASLMSAITDQATNAILHEYKNIRIWPDDVRILFERNDSKFSQIWVLHPDPWPKARHEKRRLLNSDFLKTLAGRLTPDGEIIIGTDHWEYFEWIMSGATAAGLHVQIPDITTIQTRYQKKNKAGTAAPKYMIIKN